MTDDLREVIYNAMLGVPRQDDPESSYADAVVTALGERAAMQREYQNAEIARLREVLRTIVSRADHAKEECRAGAPVSAYNLACSILGQIGSDAEALRTQAEKRARAAFAAAQEPSEAAVERAARIIQDHALNTAASLANVEAADWHGWIREAKRDPEGWQGDMEAARAALAAAQEMRK